MDDVLVVGFGLSGIAVVNHFENLGRKIYVVDAASNKASIVAAGLYNPVILKRFTMAWNAHEQLLYANSFYANLEEQLGSNINRSLSVYRKFNDIEEQNNWIVKSGSPILENYLDSDLKSNVFNGINAPFGYGSMKNTGRIEVEKLIDMYSKKLQADNSFVQNNFNYNNLVLHHDCVQYGDLRFKKVVFCEGYGLKNNPFFNYLPLIGSKGCYMVIKAATLKLNVALKAHFFLLPLGNDLYKFGATYEHSFKGVDHDTKAKRFLVAEFQKMASVPYEIVEFQIATRPTVVDRRPLVGQHPEHKRLFVFNGMGTRGILIAPTLAKQFADMVENDKPLPVDVDVKRFSSLWKDHNLGKN